jgi:hypothetical protein
MIPWTGSFRIFDAADYRAQTMKPAENIGSI